MRRFVPQLAFLSTLVLLPVLAHAAWEPTYGPSGAVVLSATRTPAGSLLVGTLAGGLYRSSDAGGSWSRSESGLDWPCCNFDLPALATNGGGLVYAGTWGGGVFLSVDDGQSWSATGAIPGSGYPIVQALAACPRGDAVFAGGDFGVVRSDDRGATWTSTGSGLPSDWVRSVVVIGNTLYALSDGGVFRLADGTSVWTALSDGLPSTDRLRSLGLAGGALALATHDGGVFVLGCGGTAWTPLNTGIDSDHVETVVRVGDALYAGLMGGGARRLPGGATDWEPVATGLWNDDVRVMTSLGSTPVAGTYGAGVFQFDAGAGSWAETNNGLVAPQVRRLAADGTHLYAGVFGDGVAHSGDQGQTWTRVVDGLENASAMDVATQPGVVFAATWNGVYRSTDHGDHWVASGLQSHGVYRLRNLSDGLYAGLYEGQIWRSTDGGLGWTQRGDDLPRRNVAGIERLGSAIFVALDEEGVMMLPDAGSTWQTASTGLPGTGLLDLAVSNGNLLVATTGGGVYRWVPASSSWVASGLDGHNVLGLGSTGAGLFASDYGTVWSSTDGGLTWSDQSEGVPLHHAPRAFAMAGASVFTAIEGAGVYRMGGVTTVPGPDARLAGRALAVHPNPSRQGMRVVFRAPSLGPVRLEVIDAAGRRVSTLVSGTLPRGVYERAWDGRDAQGRDVPAGVYLMRLSAGGQVTTTKLAITH